MAKGEAVTVTETLSRHNLGVGLPEKGEITFEGSVGYYCGGLNTGCDIEIERNCGWALGEGMSAEELETAGISEDLIRVSVGLEDPEDIVMDLSRALKASQR